MEEESVTSNVETKTPSRGMYVAIGVAAAVVAAMGAFVYARIGALAEETPAKAEEELAAVQFVPAGERGSGRYPNGSYTSVGIYAPHGVDTPLEVTVALVDDVITESSIRLNSKSALSIKITGEFEAGYKEFVIGKPIQGLEVGKVARSSLTPHGYNMALRQIEAYAETL